MAALPYKATANLVTVNMVTWYLGWQVVITIFRSLCFSSPPPQTYWTAVVVALGTVGAQNFHNTAKIVSKINGKCTLVFLCDIVNCI